MAHIRSTIFGRGARHRPPVRNAVSLSPILGIHNGLPAAMLPPGYAASTRNVLGVDGRLQPRSGISFWGNPISAASASVVLGGLEAFDILGNAHIFALEATAAAVKSPLNPSWNTLTGSIDFGTLSTVSSERYWDSAWMYDPSIDNNLAVFTNGADLPRSIPVDGSFGFSAFTFPQAIGIDTAVAVGVADQRLLLANTGGDDGRKPNRVVWSTRGSPKDWTLALGAGYEDLSDLRGAITKIIPEGDGFVIFTDQEIWRARARRDTFAFDFFGVSQEISCPFPQTITKTPFGVVFLGKDLDVYLIAGNQIQSIGVLRTESPALSESRVKSLLQTAITNGTYVFGLYCGTRRCYQLYYADDGGYPTKSLSYDFDQNAWWNNKLPVAMSYGLSVTDIGSFSTVQPATWDSQTTTWDNMEGVWDNVGIVRPPVEDRNVLIFGSNGSSFRYRSEQTTDDGTAIDCHWKSGGLHLGQRHPFDQIEEVWVEYSNTSPSSVTVRTGEIPSSATLTGSDKVYSISSSELSYLLAAKHQRGRAPQLELAYTVTDTEPGPSINQLEVVVMLRNRYGGGR